jgi:hypothetical protein
MASRKRHLERLLRKAGIKFVNIVQGGNHLKVTLENGRRVWTSVSPSCPFADKHFLRDVRKELRQ